ncbi:MAG: hypothetical protein QN131_13690 [Armatimonadota bacterium]|nr:hypothetical protein [Armatimonadota bacterium]MDR7550967.1 hypothetical protein [Armatimonadota bacterium]
MQEHIAADVARVLAALLEHKAWFRHGLTDARLCQVTGLTLTQVVAARRQAYLQGLVERHGTGAEQAVTMLTPRGVALAQKLSPPVQSSD